MEVHYNLKTFTVTFAKIVKTYYGLLFLRKIFWCSRNICDEPKACLRGKLLESYFTVEGQKNVSFAG